MTITVDITSQAEEKLQREAERLGMPLPAYARAVLLQDPVVLALARAPLDDEPETEGERLAVQDGREASARGDTVTLEDACREMGL